MRTGIFYFSHTPTALGSSIPIALPGGGVGWIRIEETQLGLEQALSVACPFKGEMVMNTHPLPKKKGV